MSEPVVFISHFKVKEGKLDELKRLAGAVERSLREDKPRTAARLVFLGQDGTRVSFVHCFPDAASMDLHFEGSDERSAEVYEFAPSREQRISSAAFTQSPSQPLPRLGWVVPPVKFRLTLDVSYPVEA